ncbi:MAG: hypothetical protein IPN69_01705 [Acidobacteria bacterium]|nr:hypothetical protein [Acidobacteriota bacterium]
MTEKKPAKFTRRWLIEGKLTTTSPFHSGSGETVEREGLVNEKTKKPVEVTALCVDVDGKPYIPGATIKGKLRAFAEDASDSDFVDRIFGSPDPKEEDSVGGKADFFDASMVRPSDGATWPDPAHKPPYWHEKRRTGVAASTQIARRTKTVSENKLFHTEFVPAGAGFSLRIGGQDTNGESGFDEIEVMLGLLEGFNHGRLTLGAETGNGWGRFSWKPERITVLDKDALDQWAKGGCLTVGYGIHRELPKDEFEGIISRAIAARAVGSTPMLEIGLRLEFDSNFLVNDTSQTGKGADKPDHFPLYDSNGLTLLPARSFRGAFRSQAERILRTIGGNDAACHPDGGGPEPACGAIKDIAEVAGKLCPACQMFGAPGWRSPFDVTDFMPETDSAEDNGPIKIQEFVAIDRFTGGSAHSAKFNATTRFRPKLKGSIKIDLNAFSRTGDRNAALGLLVLTLRDLAEGDITFGLGSAKGYGRCRASITGVTSNDRSVSEFVKELNQGFPLTSENPTRSLKSAVKALAAMV